MHPQPNKKSFFSRELSPVTLKIIIIILFGLVFLSLGLNWLLISRLLQAQRQAEALVQELKPVAQDALAKVDSELKAFQESTITFNVEIDQEFPVATEVDFDETIEVPIKMTVPIEKEIKTTVVMDPLQAGLAVPVDITVPVNEEIPIDVVIPVTIQRTIPISTSVPLKMTVPIEIAVADTELAQYIEQLRRGLAELAAIIDQLTINDVEN